jgi:protease IV
MSFGKAFFSSCLGALVALFVFVFLAVIILVSMITAAGSEQEATIEDNSILHLELDAEISELQKENPLAGLPIPGGDDFKIGLLQLKDAITHAKTDEKIKGIYVDVGHPRAGFSSLEEIRESLIDFRKSGKWVIAYSNMLSEGGYYLASACDKVYLYPEGDIEFNGLTAQVAFFKKTFDKLEIKPEIFRVGDFKSAVEPFLFEKMSDPSRLQLNELLNSMYGHALTKISESRNISVQALEDISDNMKIKNARIALESGLVDSLLFKDQLTDLLKKKVGVTETKDLKFVKYPKYRKSYTQSSSGKNEIAVIVAEGAIMPGEEDGRDDVIAAETFVQTIRKAREDEDVKAIVLRVNSPGGEFKSSDMICREVELASRQKPVIASMGDYAASGGYYISMAADTIVAQPNTVTGSIGIFMMMFDMSNFFNNKLGITFDEVRTGEYGEMYTVTRPLTEGEKQFWQTNLEEHYETFTRKAAEGRNVPIDKIKAVASGRVWSGVQAQSNGLVDVLGGFNDAVKIAAEKAGIADDYKIRYYPKKKDFLEQVVNQLQENAETDRLKTELGDLYPWFNRFKKIETYKGIQARLPYELNIQ